MKYLLLAILFSSNARATVPGIVDSQGAPLLQSLSLSDTDTYGHFRSTVSLAMTETTYTNTSTFGDCVTGSTRTWITGGRAMVWFTGSATSNDNVTIALGVLVDGNFVTGGSGTTGKIGTFISGGGVAGVGMMTMLTLTPGAHTFCLLVRGSGTAVIKIPGTSALDHNAEFGILSLP